MPKNKSIPISHFTIFIVLPFDSGPVQNARRKLTISIGFGNATGIFLAPRRGAESRKPVDF
jgi:hypothetical protein